VVTSDWKMQQPHREVLKAARDTINPRPHTPGHFIMIGTGSNRAMVNELITRKAHAF